MLRHGGLLVPCWTFVHNSSSLFVGFGFPSLPFQLTSSGTLPPANMASHKGSLQEETDLPGTVSARGAGFVEGCHFFWAARDLADLGPSLCRQRARGGCRPTGSDWPSSSTSYYHKQRGFHFFWNPLKVCEFKRPGSMAWKRGWTNGVPTRIEDGQRPKP